VLATVFLVRQKGIRLPTLRPGVDGNLVLEPWKDPSSRPALRARLVSAPEGGCSLLPDLIYAQVQRITTHGLILAGYEVIPRRTSRKSSVDSYRQSWWCLVHTEEGRLVLEDLTNPFAAPTSPEWRGSA
jgi:hypothetical protein